MRADTALVVGAARQPRGRHAPARGRDRARRARERGVRRARRRVRGRRPRAGRLSRARRRPLLGHRAQVRRTEGRGRAARAARAARSRRSLVGGAQERARARRASRTCPRGSASAPRARPSTSTREAAAQRALIDVARRRCIDARARRRALRLTDATVRCPHCCASASTASRPSRSCSRSTSTASPCTRARRARRETLEPSPVLAAMGVDADRSLRISVGLVDRPTADVERFVEVFPGIVERLRGLRSRMTAVRRLNHAVLYVRDARTSCRVLRSRRSSFEVVARVRRRRRGVHARGRTPRTTTTSACSRSARSAPGPEQGRAGLYHLAWEVDTIQDLAAMRERLVELGALVGESDHGVSKSLYAQRPRRHRVRGDVDGARARRGATTSTRRYASASTSTPSSPAGAEARHHPYSTAILRAFRMHARTGRTRERAARRVRQWARQESLTRVRSFTTAGSLPLARSASVTCSSTDRRLARSATHTSGRCSAAPVVVQLTRDGSLHRGQRPLDRAQHVGDRDLGRGPGELVAAVGTAAGAHDPGPAQLGEDVLEEVLRDRLAPGELLALHGQRRPSPPRARPRPALRSQPSR